MCELPDGTFDFTATEEECAQTGASCSAPCPGEGCASYRFGFSGGACFVDAASLSDCLMYGQSNAADVTYYDGACVVESASDVQACAQVHFSLSLVLNRIHSHRRQYPSASWMTCESISLADCDGAGPVQVYLQCFVDVQRPCASEDECRLRSGTCSDKKWTQVVTSENPFEVWK